MNTELARQIRFSDLRHLDPVNDNRAAGFGLIGSVALIIALAVIGVGFMWGVFHIENIILAGLGK
jgi:hypothetical protein